MTLAMASCSSEEVLNNPTAPIEFRANSGFNPTRGSEMDLTNLKHFHTYAYYENGSAYFENVLFEKSDTEAGSYLSSQKYYWPSDGSNLKFFAMAPTTIACDPGKIAEQPGLSFALENGKVVGKLTGFSPTTTIKDQLDIMFATATGSKTSTGSAGVPLNFIHVLSQVDVRAYSNNDLYEYRVKGGVKLNGFGTNATYTLPTGVSSTTEAGTAEERKGVWSTPTGKARYINAQYNEIATLPKNSAAVPYLSLMGASGASGSPAFVIPQTLTPWDNINNKSNGTNHNDGAYIAVCIQVKKKGTNQIIFPKTGSGTDGAVTDSDFMWVAVPVDITLEAGKRYVFTLDFTDGAGYIDPEQGDANGAGDSALGGPIKFSVTVEGWKAFTPQPGLNMNK